MKIRAIESVSLNQEYTCCQHAVWNVTWTNKLVKGFCPCNNPNVHIKKTMF